MSTQKNSSSKTVLITGASTGFGRDTAETLTREGHRVFASFRDIAGRNKSHADALRAKDIKVVELDVINNSSVESAVGNVLSQAGRIDVLINNAGIASAGVSEAFTPEQIRDLFEVNVFGVQRVLRAVLPTLRKQRDGKSPTSGKKELASCLARPIQTIRCPPPSTAPAKPCPPIWLPAISMRSRRNMRTCRWS